MHEAGGDTLRREYRRRLFDPIYGEALDLVDRTAAKPTEHVRDAVRCIHCTAPIRRWYDPARAYWIHIDSSAFPCRDDARLPLGTYATPSTDSPAPLSSPVHHDPLVLDADAPQPPGRVRVHPGELHGRAPRQLAWYRRPWWATCSSTRTSAVVVRHEPASQERD